MVFPEAFLSLLVLGTAASALTTSPAATQNNCYYNVAGVGTFNTIISHDYSSVTGLSSYVSDLSSSIYTVASNNAPFARRFDLTNIGYNSSDPSITLTVPGGQTTGPISSAQLVTSYSDILYGSVRTVAKISNVPGVTHGFTFYANDSQEIDFAFLTANTALTHYTNEQVSSSSAPTSYTGTAPSDATSAYHEYRVDWVPGATMFYIDNVLQKTITSNVPTTAGFWVWNSWSNGNAWAAGPPATDSVLKIRSINAYVNRTSITNSIALGTASCTSDAQFKILSAYYADMNVTAAAQSTFASGNDLIINTQNLDTIFGSNPWNGVTKTLAMLYTYGTEARVFVATEASSTYTIVPGTIAAGDAPGSSVVAGVAQPSGASIDIVAVVWGDGQISTSGVYTTLYANAAGGFNFQLTDNFFGQDTLWGQQKTAVIWYIKNGKLLSVVGRENAYVAFA